MSPAKITYPGVYVEETRTSIKVIPGVSTRNKAAIKAVSYTHLTLPTNREV